MTEPGWTLRAADSETTILVITGDPARLDALAIEVAAAGYFAFVSIPKSVAALAAVTQFDLVIVTSDVPPADRDRLAQIHPPIDARFLTLDATEARSIADQIRARLAG